ncbi:hypothetical protein ES708_29165 [subsurface metagenome]
MAQLQRPFGQQIRADVETQSTVTFQTAGEYGFYNQGDGLFILVKLPDLLCQLHAAFDAEIIAGLAPFGLCKDQILCYYPRIDLDFPLIACRIVRVDAGAVQLGVEGQPFDVVIKAFQYPRVFLSFLAEKAHVVEGHCTLYIRSAAHFVGEVILFEVHVHFKDHGQVWIELVPRLH